MSSFRLVRLVPLVALVALVVVAPARAQEQELALRARRQMSADDAEAFAARLERLAALVSSGALSQEEMTELKDGLFRTCSTVVISGEVRDAPLADALLAIVRAAREQGKGPGLVIRPDDLAALGQVRVSALFTSTRAADAVRALLRSQDAAQALSLEVTEESDVFVIAVHRWEADEDEPDVDARRKQPVEGEEERPRLPAEEAAVPGYLGVGSGGLVVRDGGVVIDSVEAGGPAAAGGLQAGDAISGIDGIDVTSWEQLRAVIRARSAGDDVVLDVVRDGQRRRVLVTLGRSP